MNEPTLEKILRKAPRPAVPAGVRDRLQAAIDLPRANDAAGAEEARRPRPAGLWTRITRPRTDGFRRWIPALGFACWILGCLVVLGTQTQIISALKEERAKLSEISPAPAAATETATLPPNPGVLAAQLDQLRKDAADVQRLTAELQQLEELLTAIPALRVANTQLREELRAQIQPPPKPEEDLFGLSRGKAVTVQCVNNLKQVGLAARIWANKQRRAGGREILPTSFDEMRNELSTQKILQCPSDNATPYDLLSPGVDESDPRIAYVRCPIHNIVTLVDGSVQQLGGRRVVQQDGKWIIEPSAAESR